MEPVGKIEPADGGEREEEGETFYGSKGLMAAAAASSQEEKENKSSQLSIVRER